MSPHYALFLHTLDEPDVDAVARALDALHWLARADAHYLTRRAHGVLVDRLEEAEAKALQAALADEGIAVECVPEAWLTLPPLSSCRRLDMRPEGLVIYDLMGRTTEVPWPRVLLLAAGIYTTSKRSVKAGSAAGALSAPVTSWGPSYGARRYVEEGSGAEVEYVDREHAVLDIVVTPAARYRIQLEQFDYSSLGAQRGPSAWQNFSLLARALVEQAPHAAHNRGLREMGPDARKLCRYPGRAQFERECAWCLWRYQGPGASLAGDVGPYRALTTAPRLTAPLCPADAGAPAPGVAKPSRSRVLAAMRRSAVTAHQPVTAADVGITVVVGAVLITGGGLLFGPFGAVAASVSIPFLLRHLQHRRGLREAERRSRE